MVACTHQVKKASCGMLERNCPITFGHHKSNPSHTPPVSVSIFVKAKHLTRLKTFHSTAVFKETAPRSFLC